MTKRFENAINALVQAFFDETLAKSTCAACACGNMIAKSNNIKIPKNLWLKDDEEHDRLANLFGNVFGLFGKENHPMNNTGYSYQELNKIEYAFEGNTKIRWDKYKKCSKDEIMKDQYNGLMAVVDVLCELEGYNSKEYKLLFEYEPILTN